MSNEDAVPLTLKHPTGLWVMATTSSLNSYGFGIINALLVLYTTTKLNILPSSSYLLYATYNSLLFTLPLLGGYLSEKLGYKKSFLYGMLLCVLGIIILSYSSTTMLYLGLATFAVGVSFFVPTYLVLQGKLYAKYDLRRESGFTISYIINNVGFLFAGLSSGILADTFGYQWTFRIAAVIMLLGYIIYYLGRHHIQPYAKRTIEPQLTWDNTVRTFALIGISILIILVTIWLVSHASQNTEMLVALIILATALIIYGAMKQKTKLARQKLFGFIVLSYISIGFWALYTLEPSLLTIFIKSNVNRVVLGITIPPSTFYAMDPFFIITLGTLFSFLWVRLAKRNLSPSLPTKFTISLFLMGFGWLVLMLGIMITRGSTLTNMIWIVFAYFFFSLGELFIGPIGQSMVGRLSPEGMEGRLMGVWQLFTGFAGAISGYLAQFAVVPKDAPVQISSPIYMSAFTKIGLMTIVLGAISLVLIPRVKKLTRHK